MAARIERPMKNSGTGLASRPIGGVSPLQSDTIAVAPEVDVKVGRHKAATRTGSEMRARSSETNALDDRIRVVIVHGYAIIAAGIGALLSLEDDIVVVGTCTTRAEAVRVVRATRPDIALISLELDGHEGLALARDLGAVEHRCHTVLLAAKLTEEHTIEALRLGIDGVLLKEMQPRLLMQCIRKVAAGGKWIENLAIEQAIERMLRRDEALQKARTTLTKREVEVIRLAARGLKNKEIARELSLGEGTIKVYLHAIYEKLKVGSRIELSLRAQREGII
ncbi:MAG: response regulator transcription factor [Thermoanaerobaculia bacterium]|nr:response regulator transcription factor [Thermoanaerobaculia bacterium]